MFASPTQVQAGQNFSILVLITNVGRVGLSDINASLVVPSGWTPFPSSNLFSQLPANGTEFLEYHVAVPNSAQGGSYTILLLANSASASAQQSLSVTVNQNLTTLPIAGGQIPVSLVLILIPGFITTVLVSWAFGLKMDSTLQTGLISFVLGSLEWFLGPWPFGNLLQGPNILSLNPAMLSWRQLGSVAVWVLIVSVGILVAILVGRAVRSGIQRLASVLWGKLSLEFRGYSTSGLPSWANEFSGYSKNGVKLYGKNYFARVVVSTGQGAGAGQASITGLVWSFDNESPFDIAIRPQYFVEFVEGSNAWAALVKKFGTAEIKEPDPAKGIKAKRDFVVRSNRFLADNIHNLVQAVLGAEETLRPQLKDANEPKGEILVHGNEVHTVQFLGYECAYVFRIAGKNSRQKVDLPSKQDPDQMGAQDDSVYTMLVKLCQEAAKERPVTTCLLQDLVRRFRVWTTR
jgi:hypothetical protein